MATSATRRHLARLGAPAAFLLAVTIVVLLVRSGVSGGVSTTGSGTLGSASHASTASAPGRSATAPGVRSSTAPRASAAQSYTVRKGDTFSSIAAKTGTTVARIEALNPGVSSNALQVGQKIRVK